MPRPLRVEQGLKASRWRAQGDATPESENPPADCCLAGGGSLDRPSVRANHTALRLVSEAYLALGARRMQIEKSRIPKGMSYVLRSSSLEAAMQEAALNIDTTLVHGAGEIFFDAHYWPPHANAPRERLYVRAGAIEASRAREARAFVEETVIPDLVRWLGMILALPANSPERRERQEFYRGF